MLLLAGFTLWAYGFVYSSFWYANKGVSMLEPWRISISKYILVSIRPGIVEEYLGLGFTIMGICRKLVSR